MIAFISLSSLNFIHKISSQPMNLKVIEPSVYWSHNTVLGSLQKAPLALGMKLNLDYSTEKNH